jgi:hypothetical protein
MFQNLFDDVKRMNKRQVLLLFNPSYEDLYAHMDVFITELPLNGL